MAMTHILAVYMVCFFILCGVIYANKGWAAQKASNDPYWVILGGMLLGILVTLHHSRRHIPPSETTLEFNLPTDERTRSLLVPAYGAIPQSDLAKAARKVYAGEEKYRRLLDEIGSKGRTRLGFHLSKVHTYRDVETQAFIMAHHAKDEKEIELRSMWVYLAHWFDDMFDGRHAGTLANMQIGDDLDIADALEELDPRFRQLWEKAIEQTEGHPNWNEDLLVLGMKRVLIGGPMFSASCASRHSDFVDMNRGLVAGKLTGQYGVKNLIDTNQVPDRYLAYTAKVVVEIWDSFTSEADFDLSMLMNLFYAPGLYYHDSEAEVERNEGLRAGEEEPDALKSAVQEVFRLIEVLPPEKQRLALKPVRMFVESFSGILEQRSLLALYRGFTQVPSIAQALS